MVGLTHTKFSSRKTCAARDSHPGSRIRAASLCAFQKWGSISGARLRSFLLSMSRAYLGSPSYMRYSDHVIRLSRQSCGFPSINTCRNPAAAHHETRRSRSDNLRNVPGGRCVDWRPRKLPTRGSIVSADKVLLSEPRLKPSRMEPDARHSADAIRNDSRTI